MSISPAIWPNPSRSNDSCIGSSQWNVPLKRRSLLIAPLALAACATTPGKPPPGALPLTLVSAFGGGAVGIGTHRFALTGKKNALTVYLDGKVTGKSYARTLTVVQQILSLDAQYEAPLTWVFQEQSPGRWIGTRDDTLGSATVIEDGTTIRMTYTADFRYNGSINRWTFEHVIFALPDSPIIDYAVVSHNGFTIAEFAVELTKW